MNGLGFLRLLHEIFMKDEPDIARIQEMGLLAVKIGQTFALRIDFLNEGKCIALSELFNHVDAVPPESVEVLMTASMGRDWRKPFQTFEQSCFASASLGQVHRAVLTDGTPVAVKVLKKDHRQAFQRDVDGVLRLMGLAIRLYPKLARVADPIGVLTSIRRFTLDEMDLTIEMRHRDLLEKIRRENSARADLSALHFPKVYPALSGPQVMVSELIEGETFDDLLSEGRLPYSRLLELFHLHGFFVFGVGTFHGDIHPGNILLSGDRICFVDCGAVGRVGERMRIGLFRFMEALSWYDFDRCAHWLNQMSEDPLTGSAYDRYREKFLALYVGFAGSTVSQVSLTRKMMETIKLGVHSGMVFEQGMFPIIKSLMYLDGMVLKCNPQAVLMEDMRPFVAELEGMI